MVLMQPREALAGKPLDDHSKRCIRREVNLPGVILVGGFAFDYGLPASGRIRELHYFAADEQAFSSAALGALGWNAVDRPQKEKLAQIWVAKGLLGFLMVVSAKDDDFANHAFQPPRTVTRADGSIAVTLWVRLPSGRESEEPVTNFASTESRVTVISLVIRLWITLPLPGTKSIQHRLDGALSIVLPRDQGLIEAAPDSEGWWLTATG